MSKKKVIKAGSSRTVIEAHVLPEVEKVSDMRAGGISPFSDDSLKLDNIISPGSGSIDFSSASAGGAGDMGVPGGDAGARAAAAHQQAEALRHEAEQHLARARLEAANVLEEAQQRGYEEGMAHAEREAKQELIPLMRNLKEANKKLSELKNVILKQNEVEIIDLALDIARKVIGAELYQNEIAVATVIRKALNRVDVSEQVTVKINPEEYQILMKAVPDYLKDVWIVADSKVEKGGALVETESGTFDAQISTQLEEIEKSLKKDIIKEGI